jgi:hypothetical protein
MAYRSSTVNSGNSTTPGTTVPAGVAIGDIVVLLVNYDLVSAVFAGKWPAGFVHLDEDSLSSVDGQETGIAYKRLTAVDSGSYTCSAQGAAQDWVCEAFAFSGRDLTNNPVSSLVSENENANASPVSVVANGLTAANGDDLLWVVGTDRNAGTNTTTFTMPGGYTVRQKLDNGWSTAVGGTQENVGAGATGNVSGSFTLSAGTAAWVSWLIRIPALLLGGASGLPNTDMQRRVAQRRRRFFIPPPIAIPSSVILTLGQPLETDNAQTLITTKTITLGFPSETDIAQTLVPSKIVIEGQPLETDTSQILGINKTATLGQATETDLAQALTIIKVITLGLPVEIDSAFAVSSIVGTNLGQALETDIAQPLVMTKVIVLGLSVETDIAQSTTRAKNNILGQPLEVDSVQSLVKLKTDVLGQPLETDISQSLNRSKVVILGLPIETNFSQGLILPQTGQVSEKDYAFQLNIFKTVVSSEVTETDVSQPLTISKVFILGLPIEIDSALSVSSRLGLGLAQETDIAQPLVFSKIIVLGLPLSTGGPFGLKRSVQPRKRIWNGSDWEIMQ